MLLFCCSLAAAQSVDEGAVLVPEFTPLAAAGSGEKGEKSAIAVVCGFLSGVGPCSGGGGSIPLPIFGNTNGLPVCGLPPLPIRVEANSYSVHGTWFPHAKHCFPSFRFGLQMPEEFSPSFKGSTPGGGETMLSPGDPNKVVVTARLWAYRDSSSHKPRLLINSTWFDLGTGPRGFSSQVIAIPNPATTLRWQTWNRFNHVVTPGMNIIQLDGNGHFSSLLYFGLRTERPPMVLAVHGLNSSSGSFSGLQNFFEKTGNTVYALDVFTVGNKRATISARSKVVAEWLAEYTALTGHGAGFAAVGHSGGVLVIEDMLARAVARPIPQLIAVVNVAGPLRGVVIADLLIDLQNIAVQNATRFGGNFWGGNFIAKAFPYIGEVELLRDLQTRTRAGVSERLSIAMPNVRHGVRSEIDGRPVRIPYLVYWGDATWFTRVVTPVNSAGFLPGNSTVLLQGLYGLTSEVKTTNVVTETRCRQRSEPGDEGINECVPVRLVREVASGNIEWNDMVVPQSSSFPSSRWVEGGRYNAHHLNIVGIAGRDIAAAVQAQDFRVFTYVTLTWNPITGGRL